MFYWLTPMNVSLTGCVRGLFCLIKKGLLAYFQYVPFWASIVSTGAFIAGILLGWHAKGWSDEHVTGMKV